MDIIAKIVTECSNIQASAEAFDKAWTPLSYVDEKEAEAIRDIVSDMKQQLMELSDAIEYIEARSI